MRRLVLIAAALAVASTAMAQLLPGLGGGGGDEPAVRLADPRQQLANTAKAIETRRQAVMLRQSDVDRWQGRRAAVADRITALEAERAAKVLATAPDEAARRWSPPTLRVPAARPTPDADPPDAGLPDGGLADAGPADAGLADAAATDGGPVDAAPVDAAPPPPAEPTTLPLVEADGGWLAPGVHPAEISEIDHALRALRAFDGLLASLIRLHGEESGQLAAALAEVEAMQRALIDDGGPAGQLVGLRDVERLALDTHKARIEVALARARQRQSAMDDADAAEAVERRRQTIADLAALEAGALEPWAAFAESFARAEGLRERTEDTRRQSFDLIEPLGRLTERVAAARQERRTLETRRAGQILDILELRYAEALDAMRITPEDVEQSTGIYARSKELRARNIPPLEEQLDDLRVIGGTTLAGAESALDTARVKRLQRTVVAEKLLFERLKLQRDTFRRDLMVAVKAMLADEPPDPAFVTTHAPLLDAEQMQAREADQETRCEGWRREHTALRKETPPPAQKPNADALDALFSTLDDLCGREGLVLATQGRLAEIGRFHLERFESQGRSVWWYGGRTAVSVVLLALLLWLSRFLGQLTSRLSGRHSAQAQRRTGLARLRSIGALSLYLASLAGLWLGLGMAATNAIWSLDLDLAGLRAFAVQPMFIVGGADVSLWSLVRLTLWVLAAIWSGRLVHRFSSDLMEHFAVEHALRDTFATLIRYATIAIGIALGLAAVGIGFGALAVFFGVIGIGIGFGLQTIANNFISGFIILIERPIRKGDFVQVDDMVGEVIAVKARATTIETRDGVTVIVPNSEFVGGRVVNWTLGRGDRVRGSVPVGVAYGTDLDLAIELLLGVANAHPSVLERPVPDVRLTGFGDSSLDLDLKFWSRDIRGLPKLQSDLNKAIDATFRKHAIEIPYPREDISIRELPPEWRRGEPERGEAE